MLVAVKSEVLRLLAVHSAGPEVDPQVVDIVRRWYTTEFEEWFFEAFPDLPHRREAAELGLAAVLEMHAPAKGPVAPALAQQIANARIREQEADRRKERAFQILEPWISAKGMAAERAFAAVARTQYVILHLFSGRRRQGDFQDAMDQLASVDPFTVTVLSIDIINDRIHIVHHL